MAQVSIGPYLVRSGGASLISPELERVGWRLELSGDAFHAHLDIYRALPAGHPTTIDLREYLVRVTDLSWNVRYQHYDAVKADGELFIPLDTALASLYRDHEVHRLLPSFLTEWRDSLPLDAGFHQRLENGASLVPHIVRDRGFEVRRFMQYGTGLVVSFCWVFPQDRDKPDQKVCVHAAIIEFRPGPGRILGKGKWLLPIDTVLSWHLGKQLRSLLRGSPEKWLSAEGMEAALNEFKWRKVSLLGRKELEEARMEFIRQRPELHHEPRELARALKADGLWSDVTELSAITKQVPKLILKATG